MNQINSNGIEVTVKYNNCEKVLMFNDENIDELLTMLRDREKKKKNKKNKNRYYEKNKEKINEDRRKTVEWLKEHHICIECRRKTSAVGFVRCPYCLEKQQIKNGESYHKNNGKEKLSLRREKRKMLGICMYCDEKVGPSSSIYCENHNNKEKLRQRIIREKRKRERSIEDTNRIKQAKIETGKRNIKYALAARGINYEYEQESS